MRKLLITFITILIAVSLTAQKNKKKDSVPAFGTVEKSDLEMKDCDFDNKAPAIILLDEGDLEAVSDLEMKKRVRIKILTDKGLDWANVHLKYRVEHDLHDITNIEAQTYNLDASGNIVITKLEKKLIYEKKLNKRYSEKVFTFPEAKVGSIIEYKYRQSGAGLIDWYFQKSIPVKYSRFTVDFPNEIEVSITPYCSRKYDAKEESKGLRTIKTYTMNNVPGFRDEPFIINEDFYRDRVETKVTAYRMNGRMEYREINWVKVIQYLMEDEDFGVQIKRNIPHTAELDEKLKHVTAPYEKMKVVYKYVQDNMEWNEYPGIWASDGVRAAWKDKKGTIGEINLILVNLLRDAKLIAHPVLVSTHDNGVVNTLDAGTYEYPGFYQFDKVMAFVEIDDKYYVLDAAQKETPAYLIPSEILMTEGLVIEKIETFDWGWHTLWNKELTSKTLIQINGEINEAGQMKAEASIQNYDYARLDKLPAAKKGKDKFIEKYISATNPGIIIDDLTFENLKSDTLPLIENIKFTRPLTSSGEYTYFSTNILSGLEKNPFVADSRFSDIFFGVNQSYTILANFTIPDGYEFEELPKNVKMIMPDTSITVLRMAQVSDDMLMTRIQLDFKAPVYAANDYPAFQEFYKRLFDLLNEQYVIHKKK